ncbi:hypothetical protein SPI_02862 [Niveomyces insectorum RCEF 264]|uniref:Aminoglycoside phosphotransferase domain-containing protein n=1 Tax=Niveomyces insectorum RCEF 264 TaxID=1081102 RepID=A0A167WV35_9HYPO|nr:hypothetical protein SPI_02862 [Niveomyces insectorum RCEF 264]
MFTVDDGNWPFAIFNPNFHARNILVDPDTGRITALLDLEYTNAMPAPFAEDPPLWLLPGQLPRYFELGYFPLWLHQYKPALDTFLAIMERLEEAQLQQGHEQPLSARMRASWESRRWLVNYALNNVDLSDIVYWEQPEIFPPLDEYLLANDIQVYQVYTKERIALLGGK